MFKRSFPGLAFSLALAICSSSFADNQVDCSSTCPDGERLVSFSDGNTMSCSCAHESDMDSTVADPARDPVADAALSGDELEAQQHS